MGKSKKELDRDLMFEKIMPALSDNPFSDLHKQASPEPEIVLEPAPVPAAEPPMPEPAAPAAPAESISLPEPDTGDDALTALRSRLFAHNTFSFQSTFTSVNVTEALVARLADTVMRRFNCCTCDRCRCDIITHALNHLPPRYVVGDPDQAAIQYDDVLTEKDITAALVRAALDVRAHPHH